MPEDMREFLVRMRRGGRAASTDELLTMMRGFKDNVTLDHLCVCNHRVTTARNRRVTTAQRNHRTT